MSQDPDAFAWVDTLRARLRLALRIAGWGAILLAVAILALSGWV